MPQALSSCPTPQQLSDFSRGKLNDVETQAIAGHLETCGACLAAAAKVSPDAFMEQLKTAYRPGEATRLPNPEARLGQAASPEKKSVSDIPPGLKGHSKFRLLRQLGEGGMGAVYLAEHLVMAKQVALKVISPALVDNPEALDRFHREIRAAAQLDHPNIVRALDAEAAAGLHLLVMEFVEGNSLDKLVESKGPMPVVNACRCVKQAAQGLQHAHLKGMVHRDIKPQNLMLTRQGLVKILDFGLARLAREQAKGKGMTQAGTFMGTPEYVAPEQAVDARQADIRADIYSLGCTLYFLLSGKAPFEENTSVKVVLAHLEKEAVPLHQLRPEVPEGLSAVVARMMAKEPAARFQNPGEVAQALAPFCKISVSVGQKSLTPRPPSSGRETTMAPTPNPLTRGGKGLQPSGGIKAAGAPFQKIGQKASQAMTRALGAVRAWSGGWRKWDPWWWQAPAGVGLALVVVLGIIVALKFWRPPDTGTPPDGDQTRKPDPPQVGRKAGEEFTNSLGMKFVWVPPATFQMGSPPDEESRGNDETQHPVKLTQGFFLGKYEVTQAQWQAVMGSNPSQFKGDDNRPVEKVSWDDCQEFCQKLSARDGKKYRLPTEAEWEYACRAGSTTTYCNGNDLAALKKVGWCSYDQIGDAEGTRPVGQFEPNAWGLHDMHGNVFEWCNDWYGGYGEEMAVDPQGPDKGPGRVFRGGCHGWLPSSCRSAWHMWSDQTSRDENTGCRICFFPEEDQGKNPPPPLPPPPPSPPKPGEIITNSLRMKFAWIPPGTFQMGSPSEEEERRDEETQHQVKLTRGFYLGVYEVTQGQWRAVMGDNNPSEFKGEERPVEKVTWDNCQEFCRKLSEKEGKRYRLPTEAEWEYACRAGTITPFHFGETISTEQANYDGNFIYGKGQKGRDWQQTTQVGSYSANAWGLHDMHGNVAEWCQDRYGEYKGGEETDPEGPESGDSRVVRGGSWNDGPKLCRSAFRLGFGPGSRNDDVGFRVVLCQE